MLIAAMGAAMTPVAFAYGGWQTASFVAGEMRDPRRDLSRGLVAGVSGQCRETKSAWASKSSRATAVTPCAAMVSASTSGSWASTLISKPRSFRWSMAWP